jgi:hypothetical protein
MVVWLRRSARSNLAAGAWQVWIISACFIKGFVKQRSSREVLCLSTAGTHSLRVPLFEIATVVPFEHQLLSSSLLWVIIFFTSHLSPLLRGWAKKFFVTKNRIRLRRGRQRLLISGVPVLHILGQQYKHANVRYKSQFFSTRSMELLQL